MLTEVLCGLCPPTVEISVHSSHNADAMSDWASKRGIGKRIHVSSEWPKFHREKSRAVIVANAARDHEKAIERGLCAGASVLAEKPVTLTANATQRLADLAYSQNLCFAPAHVFLFARYLEKFSKLVTESGNIRFIRVYWMDPEFESRYGEDKQYDPGLPVFFDWLPHVLSIVGTLVPNLQQKCEKLEFLSGGAHLQLQLILGDIPCSVQLVRNGDRRQRIIEVCTEQGIIQIDFSREPGTIVSDSTTMNGDPDWDIKKRPVARMLTSFLNWAAGGEFDEKLNIEIGVRINKIMDQTLSIYNSALIPWLIAKLDSSEEVDDDFHYALSEILQSNRRLPAVSIEQQIKRLREQFSGKKGRKWLRALAEAKEPSMILRAIGM